MTRPALRYCGSVAFAIAVMLPAVAEARQDSIARAKDYYASASYDEALQVLDQLRGKAAPSGITEVAAYQMFCLVALGRNQEATDAIEAIVRVDPLYHPSDVEASPRVRTFFEQVRRPLLPSLVRQMYATAKGHLEKKEHAQAADEFDRVIALLDEIGPGGGDGVADLRTLASGFRDLSKAAAPVVVKATDVEPPPEPPAPVETPKAPVVVATDAKIYSSSDADVIAPVPVSRTMPPWHPVSAIDKLRNFKGSVELVVDESGKVASVRLVQGVHADYDPALVRAAQRWSFRPATRQGTAVKYRTTMEILLSSPKAQ